MWDQILSTLQAESGLFYLLVGIFGLIIGSFLNVVILRLPQMLFMAMRQECDALLNNTEIDYTKPQELTFNLCSPPSRCTHCHAPIKMFHNVPVLGFIWLRGRASCCGSKIHWRYPIVELMSAALAVFMAIHFGCTWAFVAALVFSLSLLVLTCIDLDHHLLPDDITLPLLWLGLLVNSNDMFIPLHAAVIGAVAGYVSLWLVTWIFKILTGKIGMGHGDFKLYAALGAWLGWQILPIIIMLAATLGALIGCALILLRRHKASIPIPFGPYLALAGLIALIWGQDINQYYLQIMMV